MKRTLLLSFALSSLVASVAAQKRETGTTAYAITGSQKGSSAWTQVKLIDLSTGEEISPVYSNKDQVTVKNARTGKAIEQKEVSTEVQNVRFRTTAPSPKADVFVYKTDNSAPQSVRIINSQVFVNGRLLQSSVQVDKTKPFATYSAACAYDKKHERLYYTPMGINELRYIDLKNNSINYFQDEAFGVVAGRHDVANQITRMAFASDGNGYALSNDGNHLVQFTTKRKTTITDLGALTDDAANGNFSIHSARGFGGDMVADDNGNLYVITANKAVFKVSLETKVATFKGIIQGLPNGYSTNAAVVEKGTTIIVSSANGTSGYYKFDLENMQAQLLPNNGSVYNASDLANANLLSTKKKKDEKKDEVKPEDAVAAEAAKRGPKELIEMNINNNLAVYPNPLNLGGTMKVSFAEQAPGVYNMQLFDLSGKLMGSKQVAIKNKMQVEEYTLPELVAKGNYLLKVVSDQNKVISINKVIVQ
jgi:hypothetical protein